MLNWPDAFRYSSVATGLRWLRICTAVQYWLLPLLNWEIIGPLRAGLTSHQRIGTRPAIGSAIRAKAWALRSIFPTGHSGQRSTIRMTMLPLGPATLTYAPQSRALL